jgi:16S rRNA (guanine1207-N2)-methyltransferase/23S rRNA (guanine1835-N2)-methyltransferase
MNTSLTLLNKTLHLVRYPQQSQHPSWQAWDAADEYLMEYVEQQIDSANKQAMRIYNDDFGALACWFASYNPKWISDSYVARRACLLNLQHNHGSDAPLEMFDSVTPVIGKTDLVLLKIPKTNALLEQQLIDLQSSVSATTLIVAAAKANLIQKSTLALFEKYLGVTTTSLAKKKARLIFCRASGDKQHTSPYPTTWYTAQPSLQVTNLANVFARQQLDIGARFMLQHLNAMGNTNQQCVIDLGCGNGVLGLHILHQYPKTKLIFIDESYMAIASAKHNVQLNLPQSLEPCEFMVNNCLDNFAQACQHDEVDHVVCNPPFHQQNTITDHIAWQMFKDSKAALKKGGQLWVVGNRHLDYPKKLKHLFGNVTIAATDKKFSLWSAQKA